MGVKLGLVNIAISIINTIGTILIFLGVLSLPAPETNKLIPGAILLLISEAAGIYLLKYEEKRKLEIIKLDFLKNVGSTFAWPVLLFFLYLLSPMRSTLTIAFILTLVATIKVTSLIIKVYMIDNSYWQ